MMKKFGVLLLLALLAAASAQGSYTVATFANPSQSSADPLFAVDWAANSVTGGWADGQTGLTLIFGNEFGGANFGNTWFEMSPLTITSQPIAEYGFTGGGVISFYEAGTVSNPLLVISFGSGIVNKFSFGSDDATFSGSQISGTLSEEQFSFGFANKSSPSGSFTATAAFDSSAIPEPATLLIFSAGSIAALRSRKRIR